MGTEHWCFRCNLKLGSQEKRVIQNGKTYHNWCFWPKEPSYTVQEGEGNEANIRHLLYSPDGKDIPPHLGTG